MREAATKISRRLMAATSPMSCGGRAGVGGAMTMSATRPMTSPSTSRSGSFTNLDTKTSGPAMAARLGGVGEGIPDGCGRRGGVFLAVVTLPRPEEPPESVLGPSGHHVHVQVGDALAHLVVGGDERADRVGGQRHGDRQPLDGGEQRPEQVGGQVAEGLEMPARNDEGVAREERAR